VSAQVTDANGNSSAIATQSVTVAETGPAVTIALVDGNNVINFAEKKTGVNLTQIGTANGVAAKRTFQVTVTDNGVTKSYTATVTASGSAWSATIPSSTASLHDALPISVSAQVTDANGNSSAIATQSVTVAETGPAVTIALVDGNNVINFAEAKAAGGVPLTGTGTGIAANTTFQVTVTANAATKNYTATVTAAGTSWSATTPSTDALPLANDAPPISAQVTDANGNSSAIATQSVTVAETLPTVAITTPIAGDNILNRSEAATGVTISG